MKEMRYFETGIDSTLFKNQKTGHFVAFDSKTGESVTGYQLSNIQSKDHDQTGTIGKNYNKPN